MDLTGDLTLPFIILFFDKIHYVNNIVSIKDHNDIEKKVKKMIDEKGNEVKSGLGGWLVLVGFGTVLGPIIIFSHLNSYLTIFNDGSYEMLTTPGSAVYTSFFGIFLWGEILCNALLFFAALYLILLFFSKKKLFPKLYIYVLVGSLIFVIIDALIAKQIFPSEPLFDAETTKILIRALLSSIIWVPYMLMSKRVKATFIK